MYFLTWGNYTGDGWETASALWHSEASWGGYIGDPELDAMIDNVAGKTGDERDELMGQMYNRYVDQAYALFLYNPLYIWGGKKNIVWKAGPDEVTSIQHADTLDS